MDVSLKIMHLQKIELEARKASREIWITQNLIAALLEKMSFTFFITGLKNWNLNKDILLLSPTEGNL